MAKECPRGGQARGQRGTGRAGQGGGKALSRDPGDLEAGLADSLARFAPYELPHMLEPSPVADWHRDEAKDGEEGGSKSEEAATEAEEHLCRVPRTRSSGKFVDPTGVFKVRDETSSWSYPPVTMKQGFWTIACVFLLACGTVPSRQPQAMTAAPAPAKPETAPAAVPASSSENLSVEPNHPLEPAALEPAPDGAESQASQALIPPAPSVDATTPRIAPIEILVAKNTAFVVDYANSGAASLAKKSCEERSPADPAKLGECLTKARATFEADVLRFRRLDSGQTKLTIYRRLGSALPEVYVAQVKLTEKAPDTVLVEITSEQNGKRPILRTARHFVIEVPTSYSLVLEDPVQGRLPYDAKVGMVD